MPRYAVSHIDWFEHDLTTEVVTAPDMFEAIKLSPKAFERVSHVFNDSSEQFFSEPDNNKRLELLKQEAFNTDGMINVVEIPDK